ncbi:AraC family transcriptional regulator [Rhodococcus sovatensis]|uniref:AraC family transcriptional regulator n=1 Tax=Rhodococcus sovatensis TaxID=1805840 RepID=A0ABZ2PI98_9NOCA
MYPDAGPEDRSGISRSTSATIPPSILRYLALVLERRGFDLQPALDAVGLTSSVLDAVDLRTSYRQGSSVIHDAIAATGDSGLGLSVGTAQQATSWGVVGLALLTSQTLEEAVSVGVRYQNATGAMVRWTQHEHGHDLALEVSLPDPGIAPDVGIFLVDEGLSSVVSVVRSAIGSHCTPASVSLRFPPPPHSADYAAVFGCSVTFGAPVNRILYSRSRSLTPMPGRDRWTCAAALMMVEAASASRTVQQDLLEGLEVSIGQALPSVPTLEQCAQRRNMSSRTLRRRLAECDTTFESLVDGIRRTRVEQLLQRRDTTTFREIARQVGFSDERTLRRAIARWFSVTPSELRTIVRRTSPT